MAGSASSPSIRVGVSGFSYPSWRGRFYPKEQKSEEFLSYYSARLDTVEINSSFYAPPRSAAVEGWREATGEGFSFSFKAPKEVTHIQKLGSASLPLVERFSKTLGLLGPKRGPILFQLPPYMKQDLALLEEFIARTSKVPQRVFEFRHATWFEEPTYRLLDRSGAGFCVAESEDLKAVQRTTGGLGYYRLRKDAYDAGEIDGWSKRIKDASAGLSGAYVYLRHDETGENAILAQRMAKSLG